MVAASCSHQINENVEHTESVCDEIPNTEFETDSIIHQLQQELLDSTYNLFSEMIESSVSILEESKFNENMRWPYNEVDSAFYEMYEPFDGNMEELDLTDRVLKKRIKLCEAKTKAILDLMNNPVLFSYGECGTAIPEACINFYSQGKIVGTITLACNHSQTSCTPKNYLNRFEAFNSEGDMLLDKIKPWE